MNAPSTSQARPGRARKIKWISFLVIDAALAIALFYLFSANQQVDLQRELDELGATVYPQQIPLANNFRLQDQFGESFSADQFSDKWSLIFFGFTNCPNICPLTMVELGQFYRGLQDSNPANLPMPQVVMVTVDPERDNSAALADYIDNYHGDFLGLGGESDQVLALAEQLYVVVENTAEREASMMDQETGSHSLHAPQSQIESGFDHSGHISVINPDGELHAVIRLPHRDQYLASAYQLIVDNWN